MSALVMPYLPAGSAAPDFAGLAKLLARAVGIGVAEESSPARPVASRKFAQGIIRATRPRES